MNSFLTSGIFGAIRADWTGFTSPAYSPLFSGTMNFDKKIRFRLFGSWGESFRLPTLDALFWKEDVFAAGNPRLLPERAESREAGYRILVPVFGKIHWEQTFFHNDLKNLIVWQRRADGKFTPENVSKAKIFGREEVLHDGKQLVFRPRHVYNANLTAAQNMVSLNLSGRWVGKRFTRAENTKYLPPYETYDASFAFSPKIRKRTWNFSLSVENFTDRRYEILELYPMPGRSYRLALEIKW
jgi:outer membrane cobalamin receptor